MLFSGLSLISPGIKNPMRGNALQRLGGSEVKGIDSVERFVTLRPWRIYPWDCSYLGMEGQLITIAAMADVSSFFDC
uniref:Uncharacterized protein n=1 Tax=Tanacetum cinerariifolium TaxID=118510 RepID=A0A6L2JAA8_TANCI|nr:hypothetical protein [Tanacetum cinerariifolium]